MEEKEKMSMWDKEQKKKGDPGEKKRIIKKG